MKSIIYLTALAVIVLCFTSCGKSKNTSTSLATLHVNEPGIDGSVPKNTTRLYTLQGITAGLNYTVRTSIATLGPDTTTPDGTLTVNIYESEDAYKSNPGAPFAALTPDASNPYIYELYFNAPSSGDYVAAISGISQTISDTQFFYDLRVMSASPPLYLSQFTTAMTPTSPATSDHGIPINAGYLQIFSGGSLTLSGPFPIKLISSATTTITYPQMFVYSDASLKTASLLYSSVTDSMNFNINVFSGGTPSALPTDPGNNIGTGVGVTIPGVSFSSTSPFIVIKGTSNTTFEVDVGP